MSAAERQIRSPELRESIASELLSSLSPDRLLPPLIAIVMSYLPGGLQWVLWDEDPNAARGVLSLNGREVTYQSRLPTDNACHWLSAYGSHPFPQPPLTKSSKSQSTPTVQSPPPVTTTRYQFTVEVVCSTDPESTAALSTSAHLSVGTISNRDWSRSNHRAMIGFLPSSRGWLLPSSLFMAHCTSNGRKLTARAKTGDLITVVFDVRARSLEWQLNGSWIETVYHVSETELYPAVSLIGTGHALRIVDSDF